MKKNSKKTRLLLTMLAVCVASFFGAALAACEPTTEPPLDSPVVGAYYNDDSGTEYLLTLKDDRTVSFAIGDSIPLTGNYSVTDDGLITFANMPNIFNSSATYANDEVTLTYDGNSMKFLRDVEFTVTFNVNGGSSVVASQTVRNGKKVQKPEDPVYADHSFIGWYTDASATTAYKFATGVVKGDVTLYAGWVDKTNRDEFTVKFDLGYGENSLHQTATTVNGKVFEEIVEPVRSGYTFGGWWVKAAGSDEFAFRVDLSSYEFEQNETLFALWIAPAEGNKLNAPVVSIDAANGRIFWDAVNGAASYVLTVTDPDGEGADRPIPVNGISANFTFDKAGTYTIEVYAVSLGSSDRNSDVTKRVYIHSQLARVSNFTVVGDKLLFSGVENAQKYLVYVDCGEEVHSHNPFDNGSSLEFDFSDCVMQEGGIKFRVEAVAEGYVNSLSEEYVVERVLSQATGFNYDDGTQTISWAQVPNATGYTVTLVCSDSGHKATFEVKDTSLNIGECANGNVKVSIVASNGRKYLASVAEFNCNKTASAAPAGLTVENMQLTWNPVAGGADKYVVDVNGFTAETSVASINLSDIQGVNWVAGNEYAIKVRAVKGSGESSWSTTVNARYQVMTEVKYADGAVSWNPVLGATGYKVTVNGGAPVTVNANSLAVKLAGRTNEIKVYLENNEEQFKTVTVNAYRVAFNFNYEGAQNSLDDVYYAYGDLMSFVGVERLGYNFVCWFNSAEGNGKRFESGDRFEVESDITLYARWDGKEYTVNLNFNRTGDGTDEVKTVTVKFGETFSFETPTVPKTPMHGFMGWNTAADGKGILLTDENGVGANVWTLAGEGITVYAHWAEVFAFEKVETGTPHYIVSKGIAIPLVSELEVPSEYQAEGDDRAYPVTVVGGNAFANLKMLTKITVPSSIETIELTAFSRCDNLTHVIIKDGRPGIDKYWDVDGVLYGLNQQTNNSEIVYFPIGRTGTYTIADGTQSVPYDSFRYADIDVLIIPSSVTHVSSNAFSYSSISEIIFAEPENGETVSDLSISTGAFGLMSYLEAVTFPSRNFSFNSAEITSNDNPEFKADVFRNCSKLARIDVAEGNAKYVSVDHMLCRKSEDGSEITIVFCPAGYQFENGTYVTDSRVSAIGDKAFSGISSLRAVEIGTSITSIGEHAFSGYSVRVDNVERTISSCVGLTRLTIKGGRSANSSLTIGNYAFGSDVSSSSACSNLVLVTFEEDNNITSIGDYAFAYTGIRQITLPDTLTEIGTGAFSECRLLDTVSFGNNDSDIAFGEDVFMNCVGLEKVVLPKNITEFKGGVFAGCNNLSTIEVDPENPVLVFVDGILYGKDRETGKITAIHFIPVGVDMTNYTLPDGITEINAGVFGNAKDAIKTLVINKHVTYIGRAAFYGTSIEEVIFENKENPEDDGADTISLVDGTSASNGVFASCKNLKKVTLPARLTVIPDYMFTSCSALESIDLSGITNIGICAFQATGIKGELFIPKTVLTLGYSAFYGCTSLTKITFEDDRTNDLILLHSKKEKDGLNNGNQFIETGGSTGIIVGSTFGGCTGVVDVHLPEKLINISGSMFSNCSNLTTVNIPSTVESIRYNAFAGCKQLKDVNFAERPTANELYLEDCPGPSGSGAPAYTGMFGGTVITELTLPKGTVRIPKYFFAQMSNGNNVANTSLREVYIPNTVRNLLCAKEKNPVLAFGSTAFSRCTALTSVVFEADNPKDIEDENYLGLSFDTSVFSNCTNLTSIILPARLSDYQGRINYTSAWSVLTGTNFTSISVMEGGKFYASYDGMLYNTDKTEIIMCPRGRTGTVTIPYTVKSIGSTAFSLCAKITAVNFESAPEQGAEILSDEEEKKIINIGSQAFNGCTGLKSFTVPARFAVIGESAFNGCTALASVTFENGVTEIGASAFYGCTGLTGTLTFPASLVKIGAKAFSASNGLTKITALAFAPDTECKLTTIGDNAFEKIGIGDVRIPDSVTTLGNNVFANCANLTSASLPLTIDNFNGTFLNCTNLKNLDFRSVAGKEDVLCKTDDGVVYNSDKTVLYYYPQNGVPQKGTQDEGHLIIEPGVKEIAPSVFAYNPYITKVTIPNSVTLIGQQAFYFMAGLREVVFEADTEQTMTDELVFEGTKTFTGCGKLAKINFPARLTKLSTNAFQLCGNLADVSFAEGCKLTEIPVSAFEATGNLGKLVLPANLGRIGQYAFRHSKLSGIVIPATYAYNSSDTFAFASCPNLESVEFRTPATARSSMQIPGSMFAGCVNLKNVTLPNDLTVIGGSAFSGCSNLIGVNRGESDPVGTINIPANVKTISSGAFSNCVLITNINLMDITVTGVEITKAFNGTGITNITIPKTVSKIASTMFENCVNLQSIIFEEGNTGLREIPINAFKDLIGLKTLVLPKGLTGNNKLTIKNNAFAGTGITSIEIPKETSTIEYSAFDGCADLTEVTFEKDGRGACSLLWIGSNAFRNSGIRSIKIPASALLQTTATSYSTNCFAGCANLETVEFESGNTTNRFTASTTTVVGHFYNCTALKNVTLPDGLTIINRGLFEGCSALESIIIPDMVQTIDVNAFNGCSSLKTVTLKGDMISEINDYAFAGTGLTSFAAPARLRNIGNYAFNNCSNLKTFTYAENSEIRTIGDLAFNGCRLLESITLPEGLTSIGRVAFQNCDSVTTVTLPKSLTSMGNNPFINCDLLSEIVAPVYDEEATVYFAVKDKVLYGNRASLNGSTVETPTPAIIYTFFDRTATEFTVPDGVVGINYGAFWAMTNLKTLVATPDLSAYAETGVKGIIIGDYAFRGCGLTSVTLGSNSELMGNAFAYCTSLEEVSVPAGVKVHKTAFAFCSNLTSLTYAEGVTYEGYDVSISDDLTLTISGNIANTAFQNDTSLKKIIIAEGVTSIGTNAFNNCSNLESVVFPSTLTTLNNYAFRDCTALKEVDLSKCTKLKTINQYAFLGTTQLAKILLPSGLQTISDYAFAGAGITSITIPNTVTSFGKAFRYRSSSPVRLDVCDKLEEVIFESGNTGLKSLPGDALRYLPALARVTLPDNLTSIGTYAFVDSKLTAIDLPATLTSLGANAFDGVSTLATVNVLNGEKNANVKLATIGNNAFRDTGVSGKISIPYTVTSIGDSAFANCAITEIEFVRKQDATGSEKAINLTSIGAGAFTNALISSVSIPETVTTLGGTSASNLGVFAGCTNLSTVEFLTDSNGNTALTRLGYNTFNETAIVSMVIPSSVTAMYAAFVGCTKIKSVTLPPITNNGFNNLLLANLPSLEEVIIPEGVTTIPADAFAGCTGIKKLVLPSTITTLRTNSTTSSCPLGTFGGWTSAQTIYFTGISIPAVAFGEAWAFNCNANFVWNYQPEAQQPAGADEQA